MLRWAQRSNCCAPTRFLFEDGLEGGEMQLAVVEGIGKGTEVVDEGLVED